MKKFNSLFLYLFLCCLITLLTLFNLYFNLPENIENSIIIKYLRFPSVITAIFCGVVLSCCGLSSQSYFQNPLATQDILGINAAGSLGATIFLFLSSLFSLPSFLNLFSFSFFSSLIFSVFLISISSFISSILLFGVLSSFFFFSFNSILLSLSSKDIVKTHLLWNFGSFNDNSPSDVHIMIFTMLILFFLFFLFSKPLNLLILGKTKAFHEGVHLNKTKILFLLLNSFSVSLVINYAGPIGFIGITAPHLARFLFKSNNHYVLFPSSALIGVCICLLALFISKIIELHFGLLPINPLISILSAPIIIYLLFSKRLNKYDLF